ncbi:MAG: gliding motility-associated C-terminal domain-containing protein [Bacteroidia bacterium]
MKATRKIFVILWTFIALNVNKTQAQVDLKTSYIFTSDSIAGFDEPSVSQAALANGCYGKEFKVFLYNQKRIYIKQKYHLQTKNVKNLTLFQNPDLSKSSALVAGGACNNEDFELAVSQINAPGAIQGWTLQSGSYNGGCAPPTLSANNNYTVFNAPIIDAKIPGQVSSYFDAQLNTTPAGNSFIKLNDATAGAKAIQLSKAFIVNPNNALFQYAYLPVIQDGTHACCDQPGFSIKVTVTNTITNTSTVLACPNISVAVPGPGCSFTVPAGGPVFNPAVGGGSWVYSNWTASAIDLSTYLNNQVQIDVTVIDCAFGGHGAYVYFDAKCAPMTIIGNNNPFPAGTPSITLPTCGATGATIIAPAGLGPYSWAGPGVGPPYTTPLMSNQTYSTTFSGTHTLTMNPPGSCAPIIRIITVTITPSPQIFASVQQAPCGGTTAIASCTTAGSAAVPSTIVWTPNPTSLNSSTTQATYPISTGPVTVTATDAIGCAASATVNINGAPPAPTLSITNVTGSNSITCAHPCINYIASSNYTSGTLTYTWISLSGTASGTNVNICNPAQYTVTALDPLTGCSATSIFAIGINTTIPSSTVTPLLQNITCPVGTPATFTGVTTSTMTNITQCWTSPFSGVPVCSNGTVSIFNSGPGTYTYCVTNNINGCSTCKTVTVTSSSGFPLFTVTSPQQFTIGCSTTSVALITINNPTTFPVSGGPVSYTLLPPSYTLSTYGLGGFPSYTVNTPGQYTVIVHDNTNNCETQVPITIVSNTFAPQITATANQQTLTCSIPQTILQGTSTNTNVSYSWAVPGPPIFNLPNDTLTVHTTTNISATGTIVGTYTLSITDNINKCKSTQTLSIYQNIAPPIPLITPTFSVALTCNTPSISLTNSSTPSPVSLLFPHSLPIVSDWNGPSPQISYSNTSSYIAYSPGTYTMFVTDSNNGCKTFTTKVVFDNRIYPIVNTPPPFILDCGTPGSNCVMISPLLSGNIVGCTFLWPAVPTTSFSSYTSSVTCVNKTGEYSILVTNPANGCVTQGQVTVVDGSLNGDFNLSTYSGFAPLTVNFTNLSASSSNSTPTASITSAWSFGNGTSLITPSVSISPSTTYNNAGTYTVTMLVSKGTCTDVITKIITVDIPSKLEVPNVFTPNGDGNNDIFFLKVANVTEINATIFDRWGNKVFETISNTGNIAWDGKTQSGKETAVGTYFYIIKGTGKDGTDYDKKGNVSLFR